MIVSHENTNRDCNRAHAGTTRTSRFARALHGTGVAGALALLLLILPIHSAHAAIAFVSGGGFFGNGTGTSKTGTFGTSCTGSNLWGFVTINGSLTTDNVTTVTWGANSLTRMGAVQASGDRWTYVYQGAIPAGSQTLTVNSSPSDFIIFDAACYSGIASFDNTGNATSSAGTALTSKTISLTTTVANEWVIGTIYGATEGGCTVAHTTTGNSRNSQSSANSLDNTAASAGLVSIVCNPAVSQSWAAILGGFIPSAAPVTPFKLWQFFAF